MPLATVQMPLRSVRPDLRPLPSRPPGSGPPGLCASCLRVVVLWVAILRAMVLRARLRRPLAPWPPRSWPLVSRARILRSLPPWSLSLSAPGPVLPGPVLPGSGPPGRALLALAVPVLAALALASIRPVQAGGAETGAGVELTWFAALPGPSGRPQVQPLLPLGLPDGEAAEDRIATLGALFLAEVLGPRPRAARAAGRGVAGLRDLIAVVEAGKAGYDAVVYGAHVPPPRLPTQMTLAEIEAWIAATPGQNHALGRYQIVPRTLAGLKRRLDLRGEARFSPQLQDRMADVLIADAGHGEFLAGEIERFAFMRNLAAIWAGLPGPDGRSLYHGIAGNAAGMGWAEYRARMDRIYPE